MATTVGVLTGLDKSSRAVYREFDNRLGIMTVPRTYPRIITSGLSGYRLGLHERSWYNHKPRGSGAATYWVRVVPVFDDLSDPDGLPFMGTPTTAVDSKNTAFEFDPFPDGYACTGYRVYAHDGAAETDEDYHYQGALTGRFSTAFEIGVTWAYDDAGVALSAQSIGPPAFATALEIYQSEGAVNSRCFLGGGKKYEVGYALVANATSAPSLVGGTDAESTAATWAAITDGSFRMRLGWSESSGDYDEYFDWTGITFAGDANMNDVAATLQATIRAAKGPALYCGTNEESGIATWQAVTDGSFQIWVDGVVVQVTGLDFSGDNSLTEVAATMQVGWRAAGAGTETVTYDTVGERFVFKSEPAAPTAADLLSYLERHSDGTGTDVSGYCDGREDGTGVVLNRRGKGATTETVAWSTDHFVITGGSSGDAYRLGYMTEATADVGTDISTSTYGDFRETSNLCVYTPGKTAKRTVTGDGTVWGDWAIGMKFKLQTESTEYLVADVIDENHLLLDSDYRGAGFGGWSTYVLLPLDNQIYPSALGNPFKYSTGDIIPLPTPRTDGVTAIKTLGRNIAVYMRRHIWIIDGVDLTAPRLINEEYGVPNTDCVIPYGNGHAIFTGEDFLFVSGGRVTPLDPDGRMKEAVSRISANTLEFHGRYLPTPKADLLMWWGGIDGAHKYDVCFVVEPSSGNWCMYNHKDANCSAIIRDENQKAYLVTGSTYDKGHAAPAFTFLHGLDYRNDGASQSDSNTKQGLIDTVGTPTTTAGYLTCGAAGSPIATWQGITDGHFKVTIDDTDYTVGPCDFSGDSDFDDVAATIQAAIRVQTGRTETCTYDTDHFVITSSTTTNRSNVLYLRPHHGTDVTDISDKTYMNGRDGFATETRAVTQIVLTLDTFGGVPAVLSTDADGEKGIYVYVCDSNLENGQYALVAANTATTITVTPNFATTPVAGWYWYLGGIVPSWTKSFDFGSPQHKNKLSSVAVSVNPMDENTGNYLGVQFMQDLSTSVRVAKKNEIGGSNDTTQTFKPSDQEATHHTVKIIRPNSVEDLKIESVVVTHRPRV